MTAPELSLLSAIKEGMSCYRLNPDDHPALDRHVDSILLVLRKLLTGRPMVIAVDDSGIHVNKVHVRNDEPEAKLLFLEFRRNEIAKIVISKDIEAAEIRTFLQELASLGNTFSSRGSILIKLISDKIERANLPDIQILKDDLSHVRMIYQDMAVYKRLNMTRTDAVVGSLLEETRKGTPLRNMLVPMSKDHDDLHVHSTNVALVSIFQAEHLGLGYALLHDVGIAALLHDAGITLLPKSIAQKKAPLNEQEWSIMKLHTLYGAALLSSLGTVPDAAIVVAYEHHMKYDGTGYPETRSRTKKQHLISQIVAIADFYCSLVSGTPIRNPLNDTETVSLLAEKAGKDFNPQLVAEFVQSLGDQRNGQWKKSEPA